MWRTQPALECFSLETRAAGLALACSYSGSDEYEASIIAARRDAGAYARPPRQVLTVAVTTVAVLLFIVAF